MANVYKHANGTWKPVKNLGWLLRHKHEVTALSFAVGRDILGVATQDRGGVFQAELMVGGSTVTFQTDYRSLKVCRWFCDRPSWRHLTLQIC